MTMPITAAYAAVLALMFVGLSFRTLLLRRRYGAGVGDRGEIVLSRAIRAHANFAEYVPLALFMMYLLETHGGYRVTVHFLGIALIVGRMVHAYGVSQVDEDYRLRVFGMICTLTALIGAAVRLILGFFWPIN